MRLAYSLRGTLCLAVLLPGISWAQVTTGTILGTVHDNTGSAVPQATVTITETDKGTTKNFQTDESGLFNAPFLTPGAYSVSVEKPGFKKEVRSGITLQVDQRARLDFELTVGQVTETVDVVASAPLIRSDSAELGEVIEERAIREMPLNGRNFAQLVYLVPVLPPASKVKIFPARARSIPGPQPTSILWASRPILTAGWWTASITTNTRSTP